MTTQRKARGSALMMVMGLLALLFMLGAAYLVTTSLSARQSVAMASRTPVDAVPEGVVRRICTDIVRDMRLGANGPYSTASAYPWLDYIAYPSETQGLDKYLASIGFTCLSTTTPRQQVLAHVSNPYANSLTASYTNTNWVSMYSSPTWTTMSSGIYDSNGDGLMDCNCLSTDSSAVVKMNRLNNQFAIGVHAFDLSGLLNVNVAGSGDAADMVVPTSPVNINLKKFLNNNTVYNTVLANRMSSVPAPPANPLSTFNQESALHLFHASNPSAYAPFGIGDEVFLRWLRPAAITQISYAGRLAEMVLGKNLDSGSGQTYFTRRGFLTTWSVSRNLMRRPQTQIDDTHTGDTQMVVSLPWASDMPSNPLLGYQPGEAAKRNIRNPAHQKRLYDHTKYMLSELGIASGVEGQKMAASFVANLWAYDPASPTTDGPWAFKPSDMTDYTAYGLKQDLVITEAFATYLTGGDALPDNDAWGYAFEVYNPTSIDIDLDNTKYRICDGDSTAATTIVTLPTPPLKITIPAGQRAVFYFFDKNPGNTQDQTQIGFPATYPPTWYQVPGMDFTKCSAVQIRKLYNNGVEVPIDQFSMGELGVDWKSNEPSNQDFHRDMRRDDTPSRARYNVSVFKKPLTPDASNLGIPSGLVLNDIDIADPAKNDRTTYGAPIESGDPIKGSISDIAELAKIYFTGPTKDGGTLKSFPVNIKDSSPSLVFGNIFARGRLDYRMPPPKPDIPPAPPAAQPPKPSPTEYGWNGGKYPDVPAGCFFEEFFTFIPGDDKAPDSEKRRVYGRININTAPKEVLACLPSPNDKSTISPPFTYVEPFTDANGNTRNVTFPAAITTGQAQNWEWIDYVLAYRDKTKITSGTNTIRDYTAAAASSDPLFGLAAPYPARSGRAKDLGSGIKNLRRAYDDITTPASPANLSDTQGFLTPGELAVPLGDYVNDRIAKAAYNRYWFQLIPAEKDAILQAKDYARIRDCVYRSMSNLITVNSDTYAMTLVVDPNVYIAGTSNTKLYYYYLVVADFSGCNKPGDQPAILLFTEIK